MAAAATTAAAAAAKTSARRRHEKKKIDIFTKNLENEKIAKKHRLKSIKTSILEELRKNGRHHQILREKLPL